MSGYRSPSRSKLGPPRWSLANSAGGLLTAVFAGWILAKEASRDELRMGGTYGIWRVLIRYVAPIGIAVVFIANLA